MRWFDFKERQTDPKCFNDILVVFEAPQISVILSGCVLYAYGFVTCFLLLQEPLASYLTISNVILWSWRIWTIFALSSLVKLAFWSMLHNIAMKKYLLFFFGLLHRTICYWTCLCISVSSNFCDHNVQIYAVNKKTFQKIGIA